METANAALASLSLRADTQLSGAVAGVPTPSAPFFEVNWPCLEVMRGGVAAERALAAVVCRPGETGRGRDLDAARLAEVDAACAQHGMNRYQALSLRRQLMRVGAPWRTDMGGQGGQATSARFFEKAVDNFLCAAGVPFLTQSQQKAYRGPNGDRLPVTPDIYFTQPTKINGREVRWLDSKLFYANVLLLHNKRLAMCKVLSTAERYVRLMGPGAFVFGQSFKRPPSRLWRTGRAHTAVGCDTTRHSRAGRVAREPRRPHKVRRNRGRRERPRISWRRSCRRASSKRWRTPHALMLLRPCSRRQLP